jgi:Right handed beta helix region
VLRDSYIHNLTTRTSNGHEDGYQTEGASNGLIEHNTFRITTNGDSAIAIWDGLKSSHDILVKDNLITGGGFSIYAEDYNPGDGAPGDPRSTGGFTVTDIRFVDNSFSTLAAGCVGQFGIWFDRPGWPPYDGGPTDGWHRRGNRVLETGQNVDGGNPSGPGLNCG